MFLSAQSEAVFHFNKLSVLLFLLSLTDFTWQLSLSLNNLPFLRPLCVSPSPSQRIAEMCQERESRGDSTMSPLGGHSEEPTQGLVLQLADSKAKLRRLKQQLWVQVWEREKKNL